MGDHEHAARACRRARRVPLDGVHARLRPDHAPIIEHGGLFPFTKALARGEVDAAARRDTARAADDDGREDPGRATSSGEPARRSTSSRATPSACASTAATRHEFTTAQVHYFLERGVRRRTTRSRTRRSSPSSRTTSSTPTACRAWRRSRRRSRRCATCSAPSRSTPACATSRRKDGVSPGICHRWRASSIIEPGDFIQATDSHTCMGGAVQRARLRRRRHRVRGARPLGLHLRRGARVDPLRARRARCAPGVTAKDVMLYILANHAKRQETLDRVMEFGGPGPRVALARRARHAGQHGDRVLGQGRRRARPTRRRSRWIAARRPGRDASTALRAQVRRARPGRRLRRRRARDRPRRRSARWWRRPGDPDQGHPVGSDQRRLRRRARRRAHRHRLRRLLHRRQGGRPRPLRAGDAGGARRRPARRRRRRLLHPVRLARPSRTTRARKGYLDVFEKTGVHGDPPGCGACIGCGPGVSANAEQVTVSAINRNYQGRSGPGQLYLASPLTVAASAVAGKIVAYRRRACSARRKSGKQSSVLNYVSVRRSTRGQVSRA